MEGSRSGGKRTRLHSYRVSRRAHAVDPPSPRRRTGRRRRVSSPKQGVFRRRRASPLPDEWEGRFDMGDNPIGFRGSNRRRGRSPSPPWRNVAPRSTPPDPDDDPDPVVVAAALPLVRLDRIERRNLDIQYTGFIGSGSGTWDIPIPSLVGIARGTGYSERATGYVRVERLAFKITAYDSASGLPFVDTIPGIPDAVAIRNAVYFRFAVIYDKQSDGVSPKVTYPDVFATGPTFAIDSFRLPATVDRYEVLHDCTYRWKDGELTAGAFEIGGIAEPFWFQTGLMAHEEIFVDCDKLVHYSTTGSTFAAVASGNIFYMCCALGRDFSLLVNSRTTYSDNL